MEKHEYTNGNLTIIWQPQKCIHSTVCVKMLPKVYNPKERPWIKAENASIPELKNQIDHCPSGALSYQINTEK
ncbi:(4Fe-4S)-binding protein [Chryseobacterium sp. RG1]|uniref:(4Fe-4S)-binding protein n=1 Tax=Chryseobacterium tagetis TaxID=2801334 RepID=A0ABS8A512_9FLAO|nr:(4Fe-4S)-binding protein [Chryseobacterium tagetis]MCA6068553.1 (4Fe-4S)-binding protein [Chryseobacterium tagetis]